MPKAKWSKTKKRAAGKSTKSVKPRRKKSVRSAKPKQPKPIGCVTHYFGGVEVAIVKLNKTVKVGDEACFRGHTTDFCQTIDSMQFDHQPIVSAQKGKEVGIKVKEKVREGDGVFAKA